MANTVIYTAAKSAGVHHWQIAEALHIAESTFCRKLRHELPEAEQEKILQAIDQIAQEETR